MTGDDARTRIGIGWDVHRLEQGLALVVGGVHLQSPVGSVGHSDGDALTHAVTDAVLGAIGGDAGDIGTRFPDTDPANEGRRSGDFLADAVALARAHGLRVVNVDAVVVLQEPRLAPHREAIRSNLAELLRVEPARVSVKGKTAEGMGAAGHGQAIEARAVVLLEAIREDE